MRNCPECEREMYHWHCACGYRTPKPSLAAKGPVASGHCPDCTRPMVGDACRCGYRRPGTPAVLASAPPAKLTEEEKRRGHENFQKLKELALRAGGRQG